MVVELNAVGEMEYGKLRCFLAALEPYHAYHRDEGWGDVRALFGRSGPMNAVCLAYRYGSAAGLEAKESQKQPRRRLPRRS